MNIIDLNTWNRNQHYNHFSELADLSFAITIPFDVTNSKVEKVYNSLIMNVAINVNHTLAESYHIAMFSKKFQKYLNA